MKAISEHPEYAGMPDLLGANNLIQWEAPSNRKSGDFKDSHVKRLHWWRAKAISKGINPDQEPNWISRVAKAIHPFKRKPCKVCGKEMDIRYRYPNSTLIKRLEKLGLLPKGFNLDEIRCTEISDLARFLNEKFPTLFLQAAPALFSCKEFTIDVSFKNVHELILFLENCYCPTEPSLLGPGAMSNAPDRLDGFHSFNRCCRGRADKGRSVKNLRTYATDRRVFEFWVDGDWVSANHLVGEFRASPALQKETCLNFSPGSNHPTPCQLDHIGPISLGFCHRPHFRLLCKICNSGKNNRMTFCDVDFLIKAENSGQTVISRYAKNIWDLGKASVKDNSLAVRLSRCMRDNRHQYFEFLRHALEGGHKVFLISLLNLEYANRRPNFHNLRIVDHCTHFDKIELATSNPSYCLEQKARRIRVSLESLSNFHEKENRNEFLQSTISTDSTYINYCTELQKLGKRTSELDEALTLATDQHANEITFRKVTEIFETILGNADLRVEILRAQTALFLLMEKAAALIYSQWNTDRYTRDLSTLDE